MGSPKIDEWVEKKPESWSKLAENTNKKETFANFKKKFLKGAKKQGKYQQVQNMTNAQLKRIYEASGTTTTKTKQIVAGGGKRPFKPKTITVKRYGKTYQKKVSTRWDKNTNLALKIVSELKPRSKQYNLYVSKLVESTGRTRQAVVKKIYRYRKEK